MQYPEKRPFFLDGLEQFNTPNNLIYTRDIGAPIAATKLTGKVGNIGMAYLGAIDDEGSVALGGGHPAFNVLRLRDDFAQGSQIGTAFTDKELGGSYNRLASVDSRIVFDKVYTLSMQAAGSSTRTNGSDNGRPALAGNVCSQRDGRSSPATTFPGSIPSSSPRVASFLAQAWGRAAGIGGTRSIRRTRSSTPSGSTQTSAIHVGLPRAHVRTCAGRPAVPHHVSLDAARRLAAALRHVRRVVRVRPVALRELLSGHISGCGGKAACSWTRRSRSSSAPRSSPTPTTSSSSAPPCSRSSISVLLELGGRDENFYEWAQADISVTELTLNYRPTERLRAQLMYNAQIYWRHDDYSIAAKTLIPRLDVEYQLSRPIFLRLVGQYVATYQNNLRDDSRTDLPIYLLNPANGQYTPASAFQSNQLQLSALFAYQPLPGTVAFFGYGNNLTEPFGFNFNPLRRVSDSFFVKFSYLFRMQ